MAWHFANTFAHPSFFLPFPLRSVDLHSPSRAVSCSPFVVFLVLKHKSFHKGVNYGDNFRRPSVRRHCRRISFISTASRTGPWWRRRTATQCVKTRDCGIIRGIIFTCSSTRSPLCLTSNIFISNPDPISISENACNNCAEDSRGWPHAEIVAQLGSSF